jgi:hypothetical protein
MTSVEKVKKWLKGLQADVAFLTADVPHFRQILKSDGEPVQWLLDLLGRMEKKPVDKVAGYISDSKGA